MLQALYEPSTMSVSREIGSFDPLDATFWYRPSLLGSRPEVRRKHPFSAAFFSESCWQDSRFRDKIRTHNYNSCSVSTVLSSEIVPPPQISCSILRLICHNVTMASEWYLYTAVPWEAVAGVSMVFETSSSRTNLSTAWHHFIGACVCR